MSLNDFSVSKKLTLAFAVVVTVVLAMCGVVILAHGELTAASKLNDDSYDCVDRIHQGIGDIWKETASLREFAATSDPGAADALDAAHAEFQKNLDDARRFADGDAEVERGVDQIKAAGETYYAQFAQPTAGLLRAQATHEQGVAAANGARSKVKDFEASTAEAMAPINTWSDGWVVKETAAINNSRMALVVGGMLALALAGLMGWLLSRLIAAPVVSMTGAMNRLAAGDHAVEVPQVGRKDEIGRWPVRCRASSTPRSISSAWRARPPSNDASPRPSARPPKPSAPGPPAARRRSLHRSRRASSGSPPASSPSGSIRPLGPNTRSCAPTSTAPCSSCRTR
jgi:methyl-accepting chemotaxis protein